jgi:CelD/BcsL family acetyltransferase involved in cellulose biosynthesis
MSMPLDLIDPHTPEAATVWQDLARQCPHSYFLSWGWVEHWLSSLPPAADIRLAVIREGSVPIAAAFLGHASVVRQRLFRSTAWLLNQTGDRALDQLYIEDNAFLFRPGSALSVRDLLALLPGEWEELYLSGVDSRTPTGALLRGVAEPYQLLIANRIPAPYVDLSAIRAQRKDYLALLGSNTRSQIRRCYKLYEARAPLCCEVAATAGEALAIYAELVDLHQRWWNRRGARGAFANPYFETFHRGLIERRFDAGEVQLIRVRCGETTIGCLYNFVWNGTVSFYQSGLRAEDDNRLKPGFICHTEAVRHNLEAGHATYDFMASFDDYKLRMSTHQRELVWARIQKPRLKFAVERTLRAGALRAVAQYRKATSGRKRAARVQTAEPAC